MGLLVKAEHVKRYKDIIVLLFKHARSDIVSRAGLEYLPMESTADTETRKQATELAADLEDLGPTFVKLGQLLSTRADLFPREYLDALARLQDHVEPFAFEEVERIVTDELGTRLSKAFLAFEPEPLAAASLGQVHRAITRKGDQVAVKVQRPNIRETIVDDLDALENVADFLDAHTEAGRIYEFRGILDSLRHSLLQELDYRQEARNLTIIGNNLKEFDWIVIPRPIEDYSTSKVLTMEYIAGRKVTEMNGLRRVDLNGPMLADHLFSAYLHQIIADGFFHADPHPGNVFITDDSRLALIDLGMVARIPPHLQESLLKLLLAIANGRGEDAADLAVRMGELREDYDERAFRDEVAQLVLDSRDAQITELNVGRVVMEVHHIAGVHGVRLPHEFTMISKTLLNLDRVVAVLDPDFNPSAKIRERATDLMRDRMAQATTPENIYATVLEAKEFAGRLPSRINRILDMAASNELTVQVDAIDEKFLMEGFQKIANRITMGLVLAALIVGAALMMRVPTSFSIFGYPGIAIVLFLAAAAGGIGMVVNILVSDTKAKKKK